MKRPFEIVVLHAVCAGGSGIVVARNASDASEIVYLDPPHRYVRARTLDGLFPAFACDCHGRGFESEVH